MMTKDFIATKKIMNPPWSNNKFLLDVIKVLGGKDYIKIVGGALRDFYLGIKPNDYDLATTHLPDEVLTLLNKSKIKYFLKGIEFGTVSAVLEKNIINITTLRKDIKTDGRHAVVEYTKSWKEDSIRRDFTFNAIYADSDGKVYDPLNGINDINNKNINFIGNPASRIIEDRLRILRYFRFLTFFSSIHHDDRNLNAVIKAKNEIKKLSGDRIYREISKIISSKNAIAVLMIMIKYNVLYEAIPELKGIENSSIKLLSYIPEELVICRLGFLLRKTKGSPEIVSKHLLLSKSQYIELYNVVILSKAFKNELDVKKRIFEAGNSSAKNEYFVYLAESKEKPKEEMINIIDNWVPPVFPLKGEDVREFGVEKGPEIGVILKRVEKWWITKNFLADRKKCMAKLKDYIKEKN